jgi:uncharacterized protein YndB with AHSA1/START domain
MPTTFEPADVTLPTDTTVRVRRSFRAPRALVWRAHAEPSLVQRWMLGPPGWTMPVCEMDLRVGGAFRWRWRSETDGRAFGFHGEFREVVPPETLVHTEVYDPGDVGGDMGEVALISLSLAEDAGVTTLTVVMDFFTKEARDAAVSTGMTGGMEMGYTRLDDLLRTTAEGVTTAR